MADAPHFPKHPELSCHDNTRLFLAKPEQPLRPPPPEYKILNTSKDFFVTPPWNPNNS